MLKISAKELTELASLGSSISGMFEELDALAEKFREDSQEIISGMEDAKERAREIMDDAALSAESYHDDKSEKWQESERGEAYAEWRDRLREVADAVAEDVEPPEVQMPDQPDWVGNLTDQDFAEFEF